MGRIQKEVSIHSTSGKVTQSETFTKIKRSQDFIVESTHINYIQLSKNHNKVIEDLRNIDDSFDKETTTKHSG